MTYVRRAVDLPEQPVLIVALEGWIDPGFAAATALASLFEEVDTRTFAVFDSDEYIDLRARRPRIHIENGVRGRIFWPGPRLRVGTDRLGKGIGLLVGPEPDLRWKPFSAEVTSLALELGTQLVVGLGAFPVQSPHTRPVAVTSTASEQDLARKIGFMQGSWERPARMIDVIGAQCAEVGIPSIGVSARVPHYLGTTPYPAAAVALIEALVSISGLAISTETLRRAADVSRKQIDDLIAESEEHTNMVKELEEQYDSAEHPMAVLSESDIPSGDEIAEEFERYLRGEQQ